MYWLLAAALAFGIAGADEPGPVATTPIHLDVAVRDARGRPADKLTAADFKVIDSGNPLQVTSARFVGPPAGGDGRVVAFFLDEYHMDRESALRAREVLTAFVRDDLGPDDQLIVLKPLDSLLTLQLTRDRKTILDAIGSFEGRIDDYEPRSALEREVIAGDRTRANDVRGQIALSALHALATHLSQMPGERKALIVVSEGFVPRSLRRGGAVLPNMDAVVRAANKSNVAIYPVPGLSAPSDPSDPSTAMLSRLANDTDGRLTALNAEALKRVAADLSGYYMLELVSVADGRYHAVSVQANRPGLAVRARAGFWTTSPEEIARARRASEPLPPPPPLLPPLRTSRLIRPWIGQTRGEQGLTRITLVWEAAPPSAGEKAAPVQPSRLQVKALAPDGKTVFEGVVAAAPLGTAVNPARAVFDVPPGRVRLQMSVEDAAARQIDTDVRDVVVQPLTGAVAFGTPAVYRARTARAFNELLGGSSGQPAAAREFSRDERLLIRLPVYAADDASVSAALTGRTGQAMRTLPVSQMAGSPDRSVDLPLAGLAAGEYTLVITAQESSNESKETVHFRVTP